MNTPRTQKVGEEWVWLPCEKHRFKQLRDLVICGRDFEDQPESVQADIMEHIQCGCQFPADDPVAALADLRRDEARHESEMRAKIAAIMYPAPREYGSNVPWLVLAILGTMAAFIYLVIHR